jgi:hypothetical protein
MENFSATRLFYDPGLNVMDATIIQDGKRFIMFLKDETSLPFKVRKNIKMAFAVAAEGPYGPASVPVTGNYWCEGPSAILLGDILCVCFDRYREHRYGAVASKDLSHWEDITGKLQFPAGARHGTVFRVDEPTFLHLPK